MHVAKMASNTLAAFGLFTIGGLAGVWFTASREAGPGSVQAVVNEASLPYLTEIDVPAVSPVRGPFTYRFREGEALRYRVNARAAGTGLELLQASGIGMDFDADMVMTTGRIEQDGTANLELKFDRVNMRGNFMNSPYLLDHSAAGTRAEMDGQPLNAAPGGGSAFPVPQLEFLKEVISLRVAPDGRVLSVSGAPGMEEMLVPDALVAPVPFREGEEPGSGGWISEFTLPVPGLGEPAKARAVNTLRGYQQVDGRRCAVIDQVLSSEQQGGYAVTAPDAAGAGMSFTMPLFRVKGLNTVFFDMDQGRVHQSDMDVDFDMVLGEELKPLVSMLGMMGDLLREVEGEKVPQAGNLSDISVKIKGTMRLVGG